MISLIALIAAYFATLVILSLAARPYRKRMKLLASELLAGNLNDAERDMIASILRSAYSMRSAPMLVLTFTVGAMMSRETFDRMDHEAVELYPSLCNDERIFELSDLRMASAAAANPLFGALAYAARIGFRVKIRARFHKERTISREIEALSITAAV